MRFSLRFVCCGRPARITWCDGRLEASELGGLVVDELQLKALELEGQQLGPLPNHACDWPGYLAYPLAFLELFGRAFPGVAYDLVGDDPRPDAHRAGVVF
jgi:hypothetical protein